MGSDLAAGSHSNAPNFLIAALKDPMGANLDRVQVIKGWLDDAGKTQERIYDVAVSGGRTIGVDGRCRAPVGNTVNVAEASYQNSIGAAQFVETWQDPDFDPALSAFYYVRVIEIPTPRWTAFDQKAFGHPSVSSYTRWPSCEITIRISFPWFFESGVCLTNITKWCFP